MLVMSDTKPESAHYFSFDDEHRAFIAHRPDAPQPWINYLSNGRFHAFVSQAGGGMAWWHSPVVLRLTRYRQFNLPLDSPGFYIYIRNQQGEIWSPTWRPCETTLDAWSATHQPGMTTFKAEKDGICATLSFFVPPEYDALVWDLKLSSKRDSATALDVFAYVEHSQLNWEPESCWGYYCRLQLKTWYDPQSQSCNYLCHTADHPRGEELPLVFLASSVEVASYSGSRNAFIGDYRSERNPIAIENGGCSNATIQCGEPASALHSRITINARESTTVAYCLGVAPGALVDLPNAEKKRDDLIATLLNPEEINRQRKLSASWWKDHFSRLQCRVPDTIAERQINTWSVVNSVNTGRYSRSVNSYAPGIRGIGFRDTCQDMLAVAYRKPAWANEVFCYLLSQQYRDGHTVHYAYPEERKPPHPFPAQ